MLLWVVIVAGCFHRPTDSTQPVDTLPTDNEIEDNSAFDPNNFEDPEVAEVFDLLEELVRDDEQLDDQADAVEAGEDVDGQ